MAGFNPITEEESAFYLRGITGLLFAAGEPRVGQFARGRPPMAGTCAFRRTGALDGDGLERTLGDGQGAL